MRIAKISIHNLNSLLGKWEIDLDHPDIRTNGIFAICGPTGAGKTTILDAMSLALYGRTPRLESITQSENEVMSQSTGECASEVIFEANGQKYKAHWSQQRARKKPDGKLQQARPELSILNSETGNWDVLATQKTAFDKEVARVTGLTYEEFTRSILLAQGSFAAFLKAKSEVRSAALEKITGTQVYSEISKLVYTRYANEQNVLREAEAKLDGIETLADDVRQELEVQLKQQKELQTRLQSEEKTLQQARDWRKDVVTTTDEITRLTEALTKAQLDYQDALKHKPTLDKARTAEGIVSNYDAKLNATKTLNDQQDSLKKLVADLPAFETTNKKAQSDLNDANNAHTKAQSVWEALEKTLVAVRKLDADIAHAVSDLKRESKALEIAN
ncbi:MAG: AAA family ATPase, partial [Sutterellaceae bacterium]|nr:AAA family ATPase [Sutterellaceae bacterium]